MPTYTFENTRTGKVWDDIMMIAEKEAYLKKNKHIKQLLTQINISSGVVGVGAMKNDNGTEDVENFSHISFVKDRSKLLEGVADNDLAVRFALLADSIQQMERVSRCA